MRTAWVYRPRGMCGMSIVAMLSALGMAGCDHPTDPPPTRPLTISTCLLPTWAAYQNEGGAWQRLDVTTPTVTFDATARLAIASATLPSPPAAGFLSIEYMTADQATMRFLCGVPGTQTSGAVSGVVRGHHADGFVDVSYGPSRASIYGSSDSAFQVIPYPASVDLIAVRNPPWWVALHADRLIVRRSQTFGSGTSMPALDFTSNEARDPEEDVLSWNGPRAQVQVNYRTSGGNDVVLSSTVVGVAGSADMPRSATLYSIPDALQIPGDLHHVSVSGDQREVSHFYRQTGDRTLIIGPPASVPTFVDVAAIPYRRLRVDVVAQYEYGSSMSLYLAQRSMGETGSRVQLQATKEYFGTTATWSLTIPDLSGLPGFDNVLGLHAGEFEWYLFVSERPFGFRVETAQAGDTYRTASAFGTHP